jgi:uncharacterized protein (DUF433 family)
LGGEPAITGTRVSAERLAALIEQGYSREKIEREYPWVEKEKIRGAVSELVTSGLNSL